MAQDTTTPFRLDAQQLLNKVPEITIWFWVIKILCTTVGESFADWINMTLGVGLTNTSLIFTVVLVAVLGVQLRLREYVPFVYWLTVVVVSITGTLYTDLLTDSRGVPLAASTTAFAVLLAVVFGVWWARERTLSIHSIVTLPRELFYWLAVLVTFALGTAAGDWSLELTGWGPGPSVLLPATLIATVLVAWRGGGQSVLAFWLAYVLTRPLGANIGDWFATPSSEQGLGMGTALTSVLFLAAIGLAVLYLSVTKVDVIAEEGLDEMPTTSPVRERIALAVYAVAAGATALLLQHTSQQPHASAAAEGERGSGSASTARLTPAEATAHFPAADVSQLRTTVQGALTDVDSGDHPGASTRAKDLETLWDHDESTLKPMDKTAWGFLDGQIDTVLTEVRAARPDQQAEHQALSELLTSLG
ncbi:MAG: putative integral rane protein match [Frankiales bacterium]|nr:putative integral rane protein match [Frankiales bacterium]